MTGNGQMSQTCLTPWKTLAIEELESSGGHRDIGDKHVRKVGAVGLRFE